MNYIADEINLWKSYEATKDKNFIDFSKNPKIEKEFIKLVAKLKMELRK